MAHHYIIWVCLSWMTVTLMYSEANDISGDELPIRLQGGPNTWEGRVEVYHNNEWGQICDDFWDANDCKVVCHQLSYSGGISVKASSVYGPGTGKIWLTQVACMGNEDHIGECMHEHWGKHECDDVTHVEDAGCRCTAPGGVPGGGGGAGVSGTCDPTRHRITPFSPSHPGIGRVEMKDDSGAWRSLCDDFWDDVDAAVFCSCMGYSDPMYYRAYWSSGALASSLPAASIIYNAVHCTTADMNRNINIWDCGTTPASGGCSASREAAAVACTRVPHAQPHAAPTVSLSCDGQNFSVCFSSDDYTLSKHFLSMEPTCPKARSSEGSRAACMEINMQDCQASTLDSDVDHKHYCYDISYTQYDTDPTTLLVDSVWSRRACCSVEKNGTVSSDFKPLTLAHQDMTIETPMSFKLDCFEDETFSGAPLTFPATVSRGQDVYCRVTAQTWDPKLYLVVPDCRFTPSLGSPINFQFLVNKCPAAHDLGIAYYSFDGHNWGFKFQMPKFQGYEQLYLTCDSYVCDYELDGKPYCDRSCNGVGRRRRRRRSSLDEGKVEDSKVVALDDNLVEIREGPFIVKDTVTNQSLLIQRKHVAKQQDIRAMNAIALKQTSIGKTQQQSSVDEPVRIPPALSIKTNYTTWDNQTEGGNDSYIDLYTSVPASSASEPIGVCLMHLVILGLVLRWILAGCPPLVY